MARDFVLITNNSLEDIFYFADDIENLPRSAVAFKYVRNCETGPEVCDYAIGLPIERPLVLTKAQQMVEINTNGQTSYALYEDGPDMRIFNVGANTKLVDNLDDLQEAFFTEKSKKKAKGF